jgi:hypothetical protein
MGYGTMDGGKKCGIAMAFEDEILGACVVDLLRNDVLPEQCAWDPSTCILESFRKSLES